jgi:hypothetical protein
MSHRITHSKYYTWIKSSNYTLSLHRSSSNTSSTRYLLLFDSYDLVFVERPLWREDGSVFCVCCWPFLAQFFLGPSPLWLATMFYFLRLETSLFIASNDSQGHGGGIRPHLHTGVTELLVLFSLYSLSTDHAQKTQFYYCIRKTT